MFSFIFTIILRKTLGLELNCIEACFSFIVGGWEGGRDAGVAKALDLINSSR